MLKLGQTLKCGIAAAALLTALPGLANAQNLFNATTSNAAASQNLSIPGTVRSRTVTVNRSVVSSAFARDSKNRGTVTVELFDGQTVTLKPVDFDTELDANSVAWTGAVVGNSFGSATLVVTGDQVHGQIQLGYKLYNITPRGRGVHIISELKPDEMRDDVVTPSPGSQSALPLEQDKVPQAATVRPIKVLFIYTSRAEKDAKAAGTNFRSQAKLSLAMANSSLFNTNLKKHKLRFAGLARAKCAYNELSTTDYSKTLTDVTNASTCLGKRAAKLRSQTRADLVAVIRTDGSYCGQGWLNTNPVPAVRGYGFSVTSANCVQYNVVAHEIGHNIGLHHDRYVVSANPTDYNLGYVAIKQRLRSVMAYNNDCSDRGFNCTRVPVFSNPVAKGRWQGVKMGRSVKQTNPADNRRQLLRNWNAIAKWY